MATDCQTAAQNGAVSEINGTRPLKSTRRHGPFFGVSDMRHGFLQDSNMGHDNFLKSTGRHYCFLKSARNFGTPPPSRGGGGHSGTEWLPTAKRLHRMEQCPKLMALDP